MADALTKADAALLRRAAKIISSSAYWQKQGCSVEWKDPELGPLLRADYQASMSTARALRERAKKVSP